MRRLSTTPLGSLALLGVLSLAACEPAEERAQNHFERAVALLEKGDADRAILEFRNALQADSAHVPTLRAYAGLLRERGDLAGAVREYSRLVAQQPDDAGGHIALAELALLTEDAAAAEAYAQSAYDLAPEDVRARALKASVAFRKGDRERALDLARAVLPEDPGNTLAHLVLIADRMMAAEFEEAVALADAALAVMPDEREVHVVRLAALEEIGDSARIGAQIKVMNALFPEDPGLLQALMNWHINQGESDEAIAIMREIADRSPDDAAGYLNLAQTILATKGAEAARAELAALAEAKPDPLPYRQAIARLDFSQGRRDEAIAALRAAVHGKESAPAVRDAQVTLAAMLEAAGQPASARALAEAVLAVDGRHVEALKMRARWHIDEDRTEQALADLRHASTEAPRDPEVMTLMAKAHEREGAVELVGERLARAVEASGLAVPESLRYAHFLLRENRLPQAEGVVLDALRRAPENRDLLITLGQIHLRRNDPVRARQVAALLRTLGSPEDGDAAGALEFAALQAEGRTEDTLALLETLASEDGGNIRARAGLVRTRLSAGDVDGARAEVQAILAADARSVPGRMLLAGLNVHEGRFADAEGVYHAVLEDRPDLPEPYRILFGLLDRLGRGDEAMAMLERGIDATNRNGALLNVKAAHHYAKGEINEAIALYEEIYRRDSSDVVTANNLASLLSMHREDADSLERAFVVARRLRGTDVPHFQDTYGWILVRRGDAAQALTYLEPAASALADDPMVHYHLGMAYLALERWDEARAALSRTVELGGDRTDLPQLAAARDRIQEIDSRPVEARVDG